MKKTLSERKGYQRDQAMTKTEIETNIKRGNWTNDPCYYVSIVDGERFNVVAGPFKTHKEALSMVDPAIKTGRTVDPESHFYTWGTVKMENGYNEGCLNAQLNI